MRIQLTYAALFVLLTAGFPQGHTNHLAPRYDLRDLPEVYNESLEIGCDPHQSALRFAEKGGLAMGFTL